jgi:hypothetical protein
VAVRGRHAWFGPVHIECDRYCFFGVGLSPNNTDGMVYWCKPVWREPMFEIDLEWPVANGYVVRPVKRPPRPDVAIYPAADATITWHRPLDHNPALYAEFAKLDGSEKGCLQFAHKYGLLFTDLTRPLGLGNDPGVFETLKNWRGYIKSIRDIINRCELSRANPAEAFRRFGKQDKQLFSVELYLCVESRNSPASLDVRAKSLAAAIEFQAIKAILKGRKSTQCFECSTWFVIGHGARRSQSKFCSTRCKDAYHNRLKAQAKRTDHA